MELQMYHTERNEEKVVWLNRLEFKLNSLDWLRWYRALSQHPRGHRFTPRFNLEIFRYRIIFWSCFLDQTMRRRNCWGLTLWCETSTLPPELLKPISNFFIINLGARPRQILSITRLNCCCKKLDTVSKIVCCYIFLTWSTHVLRTFWSKQIIICKCMIICKCIIINCKCMTRDVP